MEKLRSVESNCTNMRLVKLGTRLKFNENNQGRLSPENSL